MTEDQKLEEIKKLTNYPRFSEQKDQGAGLAVLLDWLAVASRRGATLQFVALPLPLQQLARIGGVSELLGLKAESG